MSEPHRFNSDTPPAVAAEAHIHEIDVGPSLLDMTQAIGRGLTSYIITPVQIHIFDPAGMSITTIPLLTH